MKESSSQTRLAAVWLGLTLLLIMSPLVMFSQQKKLFTLEDLNFGGNNYHSFRPKNMFLEWWGDRLVHTDVEQCSLVDPRTGKETLLFTLDDINRWAKSDSDHYVRHLSSATFPYADKPIVAVGDKRSFLLVDFKSHEVVWQDSISGQEASDWCAVSRATAWVEDCQLWVACGDGLRRQLTTDGSRDIVYGKSVHRDEWGISKGTFWSPDGKRLAFYRMDQSMVTDYPQVDIDSRIAKETPDKYPMAGMNTHAVTIGVYDTDTQKTVYLQTPDGGTEAPEQQEGDAPPCFFTNLAWSPDSRNVYLQELNRDQNDCRLVCYDAQTGARKGELYRETSDKYVEPMHPIVFLPWDSSKFLLQSQSDGYNHLYLFSCTDEPQEDKAAECGQTARCKQTQLTSGPWVVLDVLGFCEKTRSVVIASNESGPLQRNIFAVSLKDGTRTPLDNGEGTHRATLSKSGAFLCDKYATPASPNTITVTQVGKRPLPPTKLLEAPDPWEGYEQPGFVCGTLKAADGQTDLYWRMVVPRELYDKISVSDPGTSPLPFDAGAAGAAKYPTVVYVYGGPHAHCVDASWHWGSRSWETYMAQKGYVVFVLDNRGSENRGLAFEQATFRQLGQVEMEDQMKGVEFLKSLPFVDSTRLGVHGWSYGGYMTISLMTNHPDVFRAGVAGGPVIDWKWYEVMYGERYMDTPQQNPEGYARTSLLGKAKDLKGRLQIIIGCNDPTVVPQHALSFISACNEAGTQPDFYVYPGEGHNMMGHASVHLHERITRYFDDHLK